MRPIVAVAAASTAAFLGALGALGLAKKGRLPTTNRKDKTFPGGPNTCCKRASTGPEQVEQQHAKAKDLRDGTSFEDDVRNLDIALPREADEFPASYSCDGSWSTESPQGLHSLAAHGTAASPQSAGDSPHDTGAALPEPASKPCLSAATPVLSPASSLMRTDSWASGSASELGDFIAAGACSSRRNSGALEEWLGSEAEDTAPPLCRPLDRCCSSTRGSCLEAAVSVTLGNPLFVSAPVAAPGEGDEGMDLRLWSERSGFMTAVDNPCFACEERDDEEEECAVQPVTGRREEQEEQQRRAEGLFITVDTVEAAGSQCSLFAAGAEGAADGLIGDPTSASTPDTLAGVHSPPAPPTPSQRPPPRALPPPPTTPRAAAAAAPALDASSPGGSPAHSCASRPLHGPSASATQVSPRGHSPGPARPSPRSSRPALLTPSSRPPWRPSSRSAAVQGGSAPRGGPRGAVRPPTRAAALPALPAEAARSSARPPPASSKASPTVRQSSGSGRVSGPAPPENSWPGSGRAPRTSPRSSAEWADLPGFMRPTRAFLAASNARAVQCTGGAAAAAVGKEGSRTAHPRESGELRHGGAGGADPLVDRPRWR